MNDFEQLFYGLGGYAAKLAHIFGAIIWLGGVLFMGGVARPILKYYQDPANADSNVPRVIAILERRLIGFNWMGLWTVFMSGIAVSFYTQSFGWLRLSSLYDWAVHLKIVLFLPIAFVNYFLSASYRQLETARAELQAGEDLSPRDIAEWRIVMLRRINVYLAFIIILILALL